ncbi:MAG: hypothetical protein HRU15_20745, partial [Planctomycetes bacterium]|nr:hypothetical protein [Planctomycetota bacterium]
SGVDCVETFCENRDEIRQNHPSYKFHGNQFAKENIDYQLKTWFGIEDPQSIDLQSYIFASQFYQGEVVKFAIDAWRSRSWDCAGSIYWMFQDCWASSSGWPTFDFNFDKKISYYRFKESYAPLHFAISLNSQGKLFCQLRNDNKELVQGTVHLKYYSADSELSCQVMGAVSVAEFSFSENYFFSDDSCAQSCLCVRALLLDGDGKLLTENWYWLSDFTDLFAIDAQITCQHTDNILRVQADALVPCLILSGPGSESLDVNYRPLFPHETLEIVTDSHHDVHVAPVPRMT